MSSQKNSDRVRTMYECVKLFIPTQALHLEPHATLLLRSVQDPVTYHTIHNMCQIVSWHVLSAQSREVAHRLQKGVRVIDHQTKFPPQKSILSFVLDWCIQKAKKCWLEHLATPTFSETIFFILITKMRMTVNIDLMKELTKINWFIYLFRGVFWKFRPKNNKKQSFIATR